MQKLGCGKIYKIVSNECDKVYIGSTFQNINIRFSKHKHDLKRWRDGRFRYVSSFEIIGKYPDAQIIELSSYDNISKKQLLKYEDEFIKNNNTVNIKRPFRSIEDQE